MFVVLRLLLVAAAMAGAFVGGYVFRPTPVCSTAPAEPRTRPAEPPASSATTVAATKTWVARPTPIAVGTQTVTVIRAPRAHAIEPPPMPPPGTDDNRTLLLPPHAANDKSESVDPLDPAFQMIKREMGIKTTIRDKDEPPPAVLRAARTDEPPIVMPPTPMSGPAPRLEPLPPIDIAVPSNRVTEAHPRLLNSRDIELDFEVTRVGLSTVRAVELWTTRDGGKTWANTDRMVGAKPPFRTRLGSEGYYGFRLVFESEAGQRAPAPKSGQSSELTLVLDTTPPRLVLFPPQPVAGQPGKVKLHWTTDDMHVDPSFLRLEYSADGLVWHAIERPTKGVFPSVHEWSLPDGVPPKVLLRVTARDLAGNIGTAQSTDKVWIDLVAPEGKLIGVRAPGSEPEKAPMPREVHSGAVDRPDPALLRAVLGALLNSPLGLPGDSANEISATGQGWPDAPWQKGWDWVRDVVSPTLFVDRPVSHESAADAEAQWREMGGGYRNERPWVRQRFLASWDDWQLDEERPILAKHQKLVREATAFTSGQSLSRLLADVDWKPSTASPESYQSWDVSAVQARPFNGAYDVGPDFWRCSGVGVRLDF